MVICDFAIPCYSINRKSCIKTAANKNGKLFERNFGRYAHNQKNKARKLISQKTATVMLVTKRFNRHQHRCSANIYRK